MKDFVNAMFMAYEGTLFQTKTVGELLFDGYDDKMLEFLLENNVTEDIPVSRFGWFAERNGSEEYDGRFNMYTGVDDIYKLGKMDLWNYENRSQFYRDGCGELNGTMGELWPPSNSNEATMFASDICRSITAVYEKDITKYGIKARNYVGDSRIFDNGENYSPAECFCTSAIEKCPDLPSGFLNVSDCKFGAPAFISYPHFYLADPVYLNKIDGMNPQKEDHEFTLAIEPTTGIPLDVRAQFQINLLLQPIEDIWIFEHVPKLMIPMLYFRQIAEIDEDLANDAKVGNLKQNVSLKNYLVFLLLDCYTSSRSRTLYCIRISGSSYFNNRNWYHNNYTQEMVINRSI